MLARACLNSPTACGSTWQPHRVRLTFGLVIRAAQAGSGRGGCIPQAQHPIGAARGEQLRVDRNGAHGASMWAAGGQRHAQLQVPQAHRLVQRAWGGRQQCGRASVCAGVWGGGGSEGASGPLLHTWAESAGGGGGGGGAPHKAPMPMANCSIMHPTSIKWAIKNRAPVSCRCAVPGLACMPQPQVCDLVARALSHAPVTTSPWLGSSLTALTPARWPRRVSMWCLPPQARSECILTPYWLCQPRADCGGSGQRFA